MMICSLDNGGVCCGVESGDVGVSCSALPAWERATLLAVERNEPRATSEPREDQRTEAVTTDGEHSARLASASDTSLTAGSGQETELPRAWEPRPPGRGHDDHTQLMQSKGS
ncbi:hypothetical protein EYF80_063673 [Liparis tanakae]|uniref:Uncharacterized protein n=1 Tax=Liparis tanakae TaxID=230148 RepID=A0A4Z2EC94_9TELE|nr:hypothetical protein EYF80_063673 [Liparis tanakae]